MEPLTFLYYYYYYCCYYYITNIICTNYNALKKIAIWRRCVCHKP